MMKFLTLLLAGMLLSITTHADAIEISTRQGNTYGFIVISGPIEVGDADRFKAYWEQHAGWSGVTVSFDSSGGSLWDGIEIGRFLREVRANTDIQRFAPRTSDMSEFDDTEPLIGAECYSACALAFLGGSGREIPEGATIGFHQFSGSRASTTDEAMERTQYVTAIVANYLREMGAEPELFERMSQTRPEDMFVPTRDEIVTLGIVPSSSFHDFRLMPKDGLIVSAATNERNIDAIERVYEIETLCWKTTPIINLYAASPDQGLTAEQASPSTTHIDGFEIETDFGTFAYGSDHLRLYPATRLMASLILDQKVARAVGGGSAFVRVNSPRAFGIMMTGPITAPPGGDPAIIASFRDCL